MLDLDKRLRLSRSFFTKSWPLSKPCTTQPRKHPSKAVEVCHCCCNLLQFTMLKKIDAIGRFSWNDKSNRLS